MFQLRSAILVLAMIFSLASFDTLSRAQDLTPGNVLVGTTDNLLTEYTPAGTKVQVLQIPLWGNPDFDHARDVDMLPNGMIAVYNGTFNPVLSIFSPRDKSWTNHAVEGWSCVNNGSYGDVAGDLRYLYVNDMATYLREAKGLIRFDSSADYAVSRFGIDTEYQGLCIGYDGMIYGIAYRWTVHVYDPTTLQRLRVIEFIHTTTDIRGLCVNSLGQIFTADWDGSIRRYDKDGNLQKLLLASNNVSDMDLTGDGRIVVGERFGNVFLTTEALDSFSKFYAGPGDTYVAFVAAPLPVAAKATTWGSLKASYRREGKRSK